MDVGEVFHLFYAAVGFALVIWCIFTVSTPRRRQDRTTTICLLMTYNVCLLGQNIIIGLGNVFGQGSTLIVLSRVRLGMNAVGPPVFLITLTLLAEKTRVDWPCLGKHRRLLSGQIMVVAAIILGLGLCGFAVYRDMTEHLIALTTIGGCLIYGPEHKTFGFEPHDVQEWLPSLVLLVWSIPIAVLIQRKGGLRWYRNRYYGFLPVFEILLFFARLLPGQYTTQFSSLTDLVLLISFMVCENKLVGEYREVKDLSKRISRAQEVSGITEYLNTKYPPNTDVRRKKSLRSSGLRSSDGDSVSIFDLLAFNQDEGDMSRTKTSEHLEAAMLRLKDENMQMRKILKKQGIRLKNKAEPDRTIQLTPVGNATAADVDGQGTSPDSDGAGVGVAPGGADETSPDEIAVEVGTVENV